MEFDLINKPKNEVSTRRRKKREKENRKSIFEIYKSEKTMKDYFFYLRDFLSFIYDNGEPIRQEEVLELMSDITEEDVEDYLSHLLYERKLKKTSVNTMISGLKSLYKELEKHGVKNPYKHVKLFKTSRNLENILKVSFEDIKKILKEYKVSGEKEYRNVVILYTLFYTGMRSQELINVRYKNIFERDGNYFIKLEKTKSGREQYKPVHEILVKKIHDYKNFVMGMYGFEILLDIISKIGRASCRERVSRLCRSRWSPYH